MSFSYYNDFRRAPPIAQWLLLAEMLVASGFSCWIMKIYQLVDRFNGLNNRLFWFLGILGLIDLGLCLLKYPQKRGVILYRFLVISFWLAALPLLFVTALPCVLPFIVIEGRSVPKAPHSTWVIFLISLIIFFITHMLILKIRSMKSEAIDPNNDPSDEEGKTFRSAEIPPKREE